MPLDRARFLPAVAVLPERPDPPTEPPPRRSTRPKRYNPFPTFGPTQLPPQHQARQLRPERHHLHHQRPPTWWACTRSAPPSPPSRAGPSPSLNLDYNYGPPARRFRGPLLPDVVPAAATCVNGKEVKYDEYNNGISAGLAYTPPGRASPLTASASPSASPASAVICRVPIEASILTAPVIRRSAAAAPSTSSTSATATATSRAPTTRAGAIRGVALGVAFDHAGLRRIELHRARHQQERAGSSPCRGPLPTAGAAPPAPSGTAITRAAACIPSAARPRRQQPTLRRSWAGCSTARSCCADTTPRLRGQAIRALQHRISLPDRLSRSRHLDPAALPPAHRREPSSSITAAPSTTSICGPSASSTTARSSTRGSSTAPSAGSCGSTLSVGYVLNTQIRIGYAYGFGQEAVKGGQPYFVASSVLVSRWGLRAPPPRQRSRRGPTTAIHPKPPSRIAASGLTSVASGGVAFGQGRHGHGGRPVCPTGSQARLPGRFTGALDRHAAMLRASSCVLFFGLGLAACVIPPTSAQRLTESAYDLNTAARFGRMDVALEHVRDTVRSEFSVRHASKGSLRADRRLRVRRRLDPQGRRRGRGGHRPVAARR